jgi:hypothetical protein
LGIASLAAAPEQSVLLIWPLCCCWDGDHRNVVCPTNTIRHKHNPNACRCLLWNDSSSYSTKGCQVRLRLLWDWFL